MRIAILAFPRFQLLDVAGPADVFNEAARQLGQPRAYQVQVIATQEGLLQSSGGLRLAVDATVATQRGAIDTLLVAGSPDIADMASDAPVQDWLRRQAKSVRRYGSVCTGAFVLAASGLLDGKRVATHWNSAARLAADYPLAQVEADAIYVQDGKLFTSAGVTAGMALALALVEQDFGRALALDVATEMVVYLKRPGGQSQFSAHLLSERTAKPTIRELQAWILENLHERLSVAQLAHKAMMSERHVARVFQQEVGMSTQEFIETCRFERATQLLADVALPLKAVAARACFSDEAQMRRVFLKKLGIAPKVYRERFATTGVAAGRATNAHDN